MTLLQALVIAGFVLVHLFGGRLRFLDGVPRSRWLSMAGGVSVAYVFLHVLPELAKAQETISGGGTIVPWIEHHAYLVALFGLAVFYGLERLVKASRSAEATDGVGAVGDRGDDLGRETSSGMGVFCLHVASFAVYNALIGYLLVHREEQDLRGLLFYSVAMGLHFLANDFGLRQDHRQTYYRVGRWVLTAAIVVGWGVGLATEIHEAAVGALFAFLAGGVVLNVLKEELPEERQSRFGAFALGAGVYALLLVL